MFEMTVEDVFSIRDINSALPNLVTVYGNCVNSHELNGGTIKDEYGNEYKYSIPFVKWLEYDDNKIQLQLIGNNIDLNALKGRKLRQKT